MLERVVALEMQSSRNIKSKTDGGYHLVERFSFYGS